MCRLSQDKYKNCPAEIEISKVKNSRRSKFQTVVLQNWQMLEGHKFVTILLMALDLSFIRRI